VVQRFDIAVRQVAGQQTRIALVAVHQLNVRPSGLIVSHEEPEYGHSVSGSLNETVDIPGDLISLRIVAGAHRDIGSELGFDEHHELFVLEGYVDLRGTFHRVGQLRAGYPFAIARGHHSRAAACFVCHWRANR